VDHSRSGCAEKIVLRRRRRSSTSSEQALRSTFITESTSIAGFAAIPEREQHRVFFVMNIFLDKYFLNTEYRAA
jgi:hypothetical protein